MKKILIAAALAALSATGAHAADMGARTYTKAPVVAPMYNWSGFYIGGQAGYEWSRLGLSTPGGALSYNPSNDGFAGGVFGGYQHQWNWLVLGLEGGYIAAAGNSNTFATPSVTIFTPGGTGQASTRFRDAWSVGGRAGWAIDNWMPYVTGGYSEASYRFDSQTLPTGTAQSTRPRFDGGYVGGGVEWAPWKSNWVFGAEYRHYFVGSRTDIVVSTNGLFTQPISYQPRLDTVMGRVSYKFGPLFGTW